MGKTNPRPRAVTGLLAILWCVGCGGAQAQPAESSDDVDPLGSESNESDVLAQFSRERKEPWATADVADPGGAWTATIESVTPPKLGQQDGTIVAEADLGLGDPFTCVVYDKPVDAGAIIHTVLQEMQKKLDVKVVAPYSVGVVGQDPAIFVRTTYHARVDGKVGTGDLKMMVVARPVNAVFCTLDVPGYAETFLRLGTSFAGSFQWKSPPPAAVRQEAWAIGINDQPVGFQTWRVVKGKQGALVSFSITSMMIPVSKSELTVVDEAAVTKSRSDGRVTDGRWIKGENGEVTLDIELSSQGNRYQYRGSVQGKPVEGKLSAKHGIRGMVALTERLGKLTAKGKPSQFSIDEYHPSIDPTRTTAVDYDFSPVAGGGKLESRLGEVKMLMTVDGSGYPKLVAVPIGSHRLLIERLAEFGKL